MTRAALILLAFLLFQPGGQGGFVVEDDVLVEWYAPIHSGGGYCSEALAFIAALRAVNITVVGKQHGDSFNSEFVRGLSPEDRLLLEPPKGWGFAVNPRTGLRRKVVAVCHSEPGAWSAPYPRYNTANACPPGHAVYTIGRTMFETDRLPSGWDARLNYMDEVWVPTRFSQDIFAAAGVPSRVIEEPIDTMFYRPSLPEADVGDGLNPSIPVPASERAIAAIEALTSVSPLHQLIPFIREGFTIFLFVGKWEARKGITTLLRSFYSEFSGPSPSHKPKPKVLLLIVTSTYHSSTDFERLVEEALLGEDQDQDQGKGKGKGKGSSVPAYTDKHPDSNGPSRLVLTAIPQPQMPLLYSLPRLYLTIPSSGEGWGRPHVEAMSCSKPILATNWSGPTAYLSQSNGYPLPVAAELVPVPGWDGHKWAQVDETALKQTMRRIVEREVEEEEEEDEKEEEVEESVRVGVGRGQRRALLASDAAAKGVLARAEMESKYSLAVIGARVKARLVEIHASLGTDGTDGTEEL